MPDFESLLNRLIQGEVEFVVVGGFAAVAHGVSLPTQDIDVCCRFTPENLLKLQEAVADLNPVHRMVPSRPPLQLTEATCAGLRNLYLDTDWGGTCWILSIDALILAKEAMGRQRDREAALQLRAIRERQQS